MDINKDEIIKSAILDAAGKLFEKWGLKKTTMEDLAKAAGKGKSTLYYYYKSKEEIFYEVTSRKIETIVSVSRKSIGEKKSAEEKLRNYLKTCLEEIGKFSLINDIIRGEMTEALPVIEKIRKKFYEDEKLLICEILDFGVRRGEFRPYSEEEIDAISYSILASIRTLLTDFYADRDFALKLDRSETVLDILFHGIKR